MEARESVVVPDAKLIIIVRLAVTRRWRLKPYQLNIFRVTANVISKGRTLDLKAVAMAREWRKSRIKGLLGKPRLSLSRKEMSEARKLTGRLDFWNY